VNLGNPDEYTIRDFADYVLELTNSTSRVEQLPATQDDPGQRRPDISLARKVLGWQPRVNVKEGILRTVQYFKKELESSGEIIP
ncbi:unnamed protein product, partial [Heterosigma akashiwo]